MSSCFATYTECNPSPETQKVSFGTYVKVVAGGFTDELKEKLENIEERANRYELPNATTDTPGGVKVGKGLKIAEDGTLAIDPAYSCTEEDLHIMDGGSSDGETIEIQILDGGVAGGLT